MRTSKIFAPLLFLVFLAAALLSVTWWRTNDTRPPQRSVERVPASDERVPLPEGAVDRSAPPPSDAVAPDSSFRVSLAKVGWGPAVGQMGRQRPAEGNAEGPMSFVPVHGGIVALDQVNGRVVQFDSEGHPRVVAQATATTQDIAVAKDGTIAMLDRLVAKNISLVDASGRRVGDLSVEVPGVRDTGTISGVYIDGRDVYVQREHGALLLAGTLDGKRPSKPVQLVGLPSKDGSLLLTVGIVSAKEGRIFLSAFDRTTNSLRYTRTITMPDRIARLVLLDSDDSGIIYVGARLGIEAADAHEILLVQCFEPARGSVLGQVVLPIHETPEETFREMAVAADGTIVYAARSDEGMDYQTARCPAR